MREEQILKLLLGLVVAVVMGVALYCDQIADCERHGHSYEECRIAILGGW